MKKKQEKLSGGINAHMPIFIKTKAKQEERNKLRKIKNLLLL